MFPYYSPWLQYDWKLRNNLTSNLGLRWDANLPPVERYDRMNRGFDANVISPVDAMFDHSKFPYLNYPIRGGLQFAGVNGLPRAATDPYYKTVQPRFGVAWSPFRKFVLRGGWGRYYINPNNDYLQNVGYNASTSMNVSGDSNRTALPGLLVDPFPIINQPVGNTQGLMTFVGSQFNFVNTRFEIPHVD
jgi:TonB dependent receptor